MRVHTCCFKAGNFLNSVPSSIHRLIAPQINAKSTNLQVKNTGTSGIKQFPHMAFAEAAVCTMGDCTVANSEQVVPVDMSEPANLALPNMQTDHVAVVSVGVRG
jgi:hypothetical protein